MSAENRFVPLPEAQSDRLRTNVKLPFGMEEEIGINVLKLYTIMQLGGISVLNIKSDDNEEKSTVETTIVGFDGQGNALAGKSRVKMVPISSSEFQKDEYENNTKQTRWINMSIKLNTEELKQRLMNTGKNVNEPGNWAIHLDKSIKKELNHKSAKYLTGSLATLEKANAMVLYMHCILSSMGISLANVITKTINPHIPDFSHFLTNIIAVGVINTMFNSGLSGFEKKGEAKGARISLFCGFEIDRLALLLFNTSTSTLIKTLK
ncbi:hypothetical protein KJ570_01880 [Patescibacteria group bacterium]|nr:hypothetical protein [Patescibacteria group bacterium]MBU2036583.1 hypothetical protein [Patescibacteria group bacterium]